MPLKKEHIPNLITVLRLSLVFLILPLLKFKFFIASGLLTAASHIGDWLDGYLAKKWKAQSDLGKFLDPLADKITVILIFVVFLDFRWIPLWILLIIIAREFYVTGIRGFFLSVYQESLAARTWGRSKMVSQAIVQIYIMLGHGFVDETKDIPFQNWGYAIILALALISGAEYTWLAIKKYRGINGGS